MFQQIKRFNQIKSYLINNMETIGALNDFSPFDDLACDTQNAHHILNIVISAGFSPENKQMTFTWHTDRYVTTRWTTWQDIIAASCSAFVSSGAKTAEQTGTYRGEINREIAGRHFEHLLCKTTWESRWGIMNNHLYKATLKLQK